MDNSLVQRTDNGLSYYQFSLFQSIPGLIHGIFSRHGGISQGPYAELNLSFSVGDDPQKVTHNRAQAFKTLGLRLVQSLKQIHGKDSVVISEPLTAAASPSLEIHSGDILMTNVPGQGLMIKQADCQSLLFYDPQQKAIANIHCGWRGNVQNVIGEAVRQMQRNFGTQPEHLKVGIGPSLGPCCAQFINYQNEFPAEYWTYQTRPYYFDLWSLSRDQLIAAGVLKGNIEVAGLCTSCRTDLFFSYRKEKITGRFATIVALQLIF
jgi:YfiH family protein